jgi:hypothetical protein
MATRRLSARNGHAQLERRLEHLELAANGTSAQDERLQLLVEVWRALPLRVRCALEGVKEYSDVSLHVGQAVDRVLRGVDPTVRVAGWLLRFGWHRLGGVRMLEAGSNTCDVGRCPGCDVAAGELLGSSVGELHTLWSADPDGAIWIALWREQGTRDADVLDKAGLHESTIRLLDAAAGLATAPCEHDHAWPSRWPFVALESRLIDLFGRPG